MRDEMKRLIELDRERTLFSHIGALLGWDQETYLPERGVEERAEQLALIEGMAHEKAVRPEIGDLLEALEADKDLEDVEKAYLRVPDASRQGKKIAFRSRHRNGEADKFVPGFLGPGAEGQQLRRLRSLFAKNDQPQCRDGSGSGAFDRTALRCASRSVRDWKHRGFHRESILCEKDDLVRILGKILSPPGRRLIPAQYSSAFRPGEVSAYFMDAVGFDKSRGRLDTPLTLYVYLSGMSQIRRATSKIYLLMHIQHIHEAGHAL